MIGLKKRDIKKALKAGAKAGGVSLADVRADLQDYQKDKSVIQNKCCKGDCIMEHFKRNSIQSYTT